MPKECQDVQVQRNGKDDKSAKYAEGIPKEF